MTNDPITEPLDRLGQLHQMYNVALKIPGVDPEHEEMKAFETSRVSCIRRFDELRGDAPATLDHLHRALRKGADERSLVEIFDRMSADDPTRDVALEWLGSIGVDPAASDGTAK